MHLSVLAGESSWKLLYEGPAGAACGTAPGLGRSSLKGVATALATLEAVASSAACMSCESVADLKIWCWPIQQGRQLAAELAKSRLHPAHSQPKRTLCLTARSAHGQASFTAPPCSSASRCASAQSSRSSAATNREQASAAMVQCSAVQCWLQLAQMLRVSVHKAAEAE